MKDAFVDMLCAMSSNYKWYAIWKSRPLVWAFYPLHEALCPDRLGDQKPLTTDEEWDEAIRKMEELWAR